MAGIFVVSGIRDLSAVPGGISDKAGHGLAYGGLAVFVLRAREPNAKWPNSLPRRTDWSACGD